MATLVAMEYTRLGMEFLPCPVCFTAEVIKRIAELAADGSECQTKDILDFVLKELDDDGHAHKSLH